MTVFTSGGQARTFDYRADDMGDAPFAMGHYSENTGFTTLRLLELVRSDRYANFSLNRWLPLMPPPWSGLHLDVGNEFLASLQKEKPLVFLPTGQT